jgi:uncharacterized membrane protein YeaQ/YmgE (transglycosylase-associated protein family)
LFSLFCRCEYHVGSQPYLYFEVAAMGAVAWIALGLLAGVIAKYLVPGAEATSWPLVILLGMAGAIVGGFIGTLLGFGDVSGFDLRSLALAVGGAVLVILGYRALKK